MFVLLTDLPHLPDSDTNWFTPKPSKFLHWQVVSLVFLQNFLKMLNLTSSKPEIHFVFERRNSPRDATNNSPHQIEELPGPSSAVDSSVQAGANSNGNLLWSIIYYSIPSIMEQRRELIYSFMFMREWLIVFYCFLLWSQNGWRF